MKTILALLLLSTVAQAQERDVRFVIMINEEGGTQREIYRSPPITFTACDKRQRNIWAQEWPQTSEGWNVVDAACVPVSEGK